MYQDRWIDELRQATLVKLSPILHAALAAAAMTVRELVELIVAGGGHVRVGEHPVRDAALLTVLPADIAIDSRGPTFDLCMPSGHRPHAYRYCEAEQVPFVDLPRLEIPETLLHALSGRRLSSFADEFFPALQALDPIIEDARSIGKDDGQFIRLSFEYDWLTVPVGGLENAEAWLRLQTDEERPYSYGVNSVLDPAIDAVLGVTPALRIIEDMAGIMKQAGLPDLKKALDAQELENLQNEQP